MIPINSQTPLKVDLHPLGHLKVHSVFATIQGEGPNVGVPAVFLRLAGCNLQCPGCDTEYTEGAEEMTPEEIVRAVDIAADGQPIKLVVITGGEPFRQNILPAVNLLRLRYTVQVETNGTLGIDEKRLRQAFGIHEFDFEEQLKGFHIVVSPKSGKIHESLFPFIAACKYVLDADHVSEVDGLPTSVLGMPASPARPHGEWMTVYLQPADESHGQTSANRRNTEAVIKSCMKFGYRYGAQLHKFLNLP